MKKMKMKDKKSTYYQKKTANYWWLKIILISYKNGISKDYKLGTTFDNVPRFITKKMDRSSWSVR